MQGIRGLHCAASLHDAQMGGTVASSSLCYLRTVSAQRHFLRLASLPPPASQNRPTGPRAQLFTEGRYQSVESLLDLMQKVGQEHGGKSRAQVRTGPGEGRWVSSGVAGWGRSTVARRGRR